MHAYTHTYTYLPTYIHIYVCRERALPRHLRNSDLRIAYLSQQQLRSFNLPYQVRVWGGRGG